MGVHGSITGKTIMRITCFDHITTATTPLPNLDLEVNTGTMHTVQKK